MVCLTRIFLSIILALPFLVQAQSTPLFEIGKRFTSVFTRQQFPAGNQNWGSVQDSAGIIYFANNDGVLTFDGHFWNLIPVTDDSSVVRAVAIGKDGTLWVGAEGQFGYLTRGKNRKHEFTSLVASLPDSGFEISVVRKILPADGVTYFVTPKAIIAHTDSSSSLILPETQFQNAWQVHDRIFAREKSTGLVEILKNQVQPVPGGNQFTSDEIFAILPLPDQKVLIAARTTGLWVLSLSQNTIKKDSRFIEADQFIIENRVYSGMTLSSGNLVLSTLLGGVIILTPDGVLTEVLTKSKGLRENKVYSVMEDHQGFLWICHERGITRVDYHSPVSYWNETIGLDGSVYDIIRFDVHLYVATGSGLNRIDDKGAERIDGPATQVWDLAIFKGNLYAATNDGVLKIRGLKSEFISKEAAYSLLSLSNGLLAGLRSGLQFFPSGLNPRKIGPGISGEIMGLTRSPDGFIWISTRLSGLIRIAETSLSDKELTDFRTFSETDGLPGSNFLQVYSLPVGITVATQNGPFLFNPATQKFEPAGEKFFGSGRETAIYKLGLTPSGDLITDNRLLLSPGLGGYVIRDSTLFAKLPPMEFWAIYPEADGTIWIGGTEGLFRLDRQFQLQKPPVIRPLIRQITAGTDWVLFDPLPESDPPKLKFENNRVTVSYSFPDFQTGEAVKFRTLLEGFDDFWSDWTTFHEKEYTNLPEGTYTFRVIASLASGKSSPETSFRFTILPPWYRTWWMILIYVLAGGSLLWAIILKWMNQYKNENEALEKKVASRTSELQLAMNDLKSVQTQLVQSEKMASLGILTGGIAHEINNPVNFIHSALPPLKQDIADISELLGSISELILSDLPQPEKVEKLRQLLLETNPTDLTREINVLLEGIESGTSRTIGIVQSLRNFTRLDEDEVKKLNLNDSLDAAVLLLSNMTGDQITVTTEYDSLPEIEGYPGQINQVLMNVLVNAVESIDGSGSIHIKTEPAGDRIRVIISDTGHGMDSKTLPRIFDPFFTTRPIGKNKGLGLSIAYQILQNHDGAISLSSEPGKGTTVIMEFPVGYGGK